MKKLLVFMVVGVVMLSFAGCGEKKVETFPYEMNDLITFDLPIDFSGQSDGLGGVVVTEEGKEWSIIISPTEYSSGLSQGDSWDAIKAFALNYGDTKEVKIGEQSAIRVRLGNMQTTFAPLDEKHYLAVMISTDLTMEEAEKIFNQLEKDPRVKQMVNSIKVK